MTKADLAKRIYEVSRLEGYFTLRSGQTSNVYFDKYQFESRPDILASIADYMSKMVPKETQLVGALEMGGIPIATAISLLINIPVVFLRKEAKEYGTCKFAEGPDIENKNICLIEDVITTGGQVAITTEMLRQQKAIVKNVLCVIDRSHGQTEKLTKAGLALQALFQMKDLEP